MIEGLIVLVLLCTVMAGASFLVGSLPLTLTLSPRSLKLLTALGSGVLVGTALVVIIPEGIETLYSADGSSHSHDKRSLMARDTPYVWSTIAQRDVLRKETMPQLSNTLAAAHDDAVSILPVGGLGKPTEGDFGQFDTGLHTTQNAKADDDLDDLDDYIDGRKKHDDDDKDDDDHNPHAYVGISIILGFILMYLIDELPKYISPPSQPRRFQINLTSLSFNRAGSGTEGEAEAETHDEAKASSTTVGLVIHAAADGVALGASSTSKSSLSFIIFIALMVHKAPAAFGLTSVLLKQGVNKRVARAHLMIFSLAAPVGALITWTLAHLLGFAGSGVNTEFFTGLLLLFSGGTFLYVAMHTMQDTQKEHTPESNGYAEPSMGIYEPSQQKGTNTDGLIETGVTVLGMLLPLLTQFGHAH